MFENKIYLDEGAGGGTVAGAAPQPSEGAGPAPQQPTYEAWMASQPADVKSMVDGHIGGLKTALQSERERAKGLEKDLREAASKAEKGSESEKQLIELANQAQEAGRKSAFYENASTAGVTNLKLAYMAAKNDELFKKDGSVDFEALKKGYPELFGTQKASNNAGAGGGQGLVKQSMDAYIRSRAGGG